MNLVKWKSPFLSNPSANLIPGWFFDEDFWPQEVGNITVYETDDSVITKANVAGVPADNISVTVEGGLLTIKGSFEESEEDKKKIKTLYKQAKKAQYLYNVSVPCPVKTEEVKADVENGIITVTLPKEESAKPKEVKVMDKNKK